MEAEAEAEAEAVDGKLKEAEVETKEKLTAVPSLVWTHPPGSQRLRLPRHRKPPQRRHLFATKKEQNCSHLDSGCCSTKKLTPPAPLESTIASNPRKSCPPSGRSIGTIFWSSIWSLDPALCSSSGFSQLDWITF